MYAIRGEARGKAPIIGNKHGIVIKIVIAVFQGNVFSLGVKVCNQRSGISDRGIPSNLIGWKRGTYNNLDAGICCHFCHCCYVGADVIVGNITLILSDVINAAKNADRQGRTINDIILETGQHLS